MSAPRRTILYFTSALLALLVLLLGALAARQEAPVMSAATAHHAVRIKPACGPAFHQLAAHKCAKHASPPVRKHHRTRAHRVAVAKVAVPPASCLIRPAAYYEERALLPLASVYRYAFFREITPPPPKDC